MTLRLAHAALAVALALPACNEAPHDPYQPGGPFGRFRFAHAAPDTAADTMRIRLDVYVAGTGVATNMAYRSATAYAPILAGTWPIRARRTFDTSAVLITENLTIAQGVDYTVLATDTLPTVATLVLTDTNTAAAGDSARIRVVHASPAMGATDVYITSPTADLTAESPDISGLAYPGAAAYLTVPIGTHRVRFTTAATKTVLLDVTGMPFPALTRGQVRTIVALDRSRTGAPFTFAVLADR
jgi:hypothetical protein